MSYSRRSRYSRSPSPYKRYSRSISRSRSRSRSHDFNVAENPGNNLYVTGLSNRVSKRDLEKHFSTEGKVEDVRLVVDPWTQESRGFGFVTMSTVEEANRCIKYLDRSVLEGRVIIVEKARRRRGRTPTPGRYLGLRTVHRRRQSHSYSHFSRSLSPCYSSERDRSRSRSYSPYYSRHRQSYSSHHHRRLYSPYHHSGRSCSQYRSPSYCRSPVSRRDQSYSPYHSPSYSRSPVSRRDQSYSSYHSPSYGRSPVSRRDQSYSPYHSSYSRSPVSRRDESYSPYHSPSYSRSPVSSRDQSYSPYHSPSYSRSPVSGRGRSYSPYHYSPDRHYRRHYRSTSRVLSPDNHNYRSWHRHCSQSNSPRHRRNLSKSYSCSLSLRYSRRSYSRCTSPNYSRTYSRSVSLSPRKRSVSPGSDKWEISGKTTLGVHADSTSSSGTVLIFLHQSLTVHTAVL